MDEINPEFPQTDVVVIIGANDVVNPAARTDPGEPDLRHADPRRRPGRRTSSSSSAALSPGFAGIDNPLFYDPKTSMLFGGREEGARAASARRSRACSRGRPVLLGAATSRRPSRPSARSRPCATAFVAHARGEWTMQPKLYVTNYPAGDFRAMPALGGGHALLKWVTSFPGQPRARAADRDRARDRSRTRETGARRGAARRGRGDGAPHRRRGGARGGDARPSARAGGGDRRRRERARGGADACGARPRGRALGRRRGARARGRRRARRRASPASREDALAADVVVTVTPGREILLGRGLAASRASTSA